MRTTRLILLALLVSCWLSGCTGERPMSAIVYDALQNREKMVHPGDDPVPPPTPSYDAYQREREKILSEETKSEP